MIIEIAFIFTAVVLIHATFKMIGAVLGNGITLAYLIPILGKPTPTTWYIVYPATAFQVWFWAERLGVFVQ
jgi:hypothetical protein